ncbi:MAG TPA: RHS repeat-associated core domain-containing protein [Polyangiaceae bacterium]|nr:RHS repeat-associated core domain-containing protein [Polyangiaceae bacterium]
MRRAWILALTALASVGCGGGKHSEDGANGCPVGGGGSCPAAPPLDRTVITTIAEAAKFLYTGPNSLQKDVAKDALDPKRVAIVRGKVTDGAGEVASGVKISVVGHAELGWTLTRADGLFDMAVNGGSHLVFAYAKDGYISTQRTLTPGWQRYLNAPEVGLVTLAGKSSQISADASAQQVASAEPTTDGHGTRQPLVLFAPGTTADAKLPDGSTQPLSNLSVHVTEYPLDLSPEMPTRTQRFAPGSLPASGNVNYSLDFTVDEAEKLGATSVAFSKPVTVYVENFLGLPAGSPVPLGYYDRGSSHWDAGAKSGVVVRIVDEARGKASLDIDGDGKVDSGHGLEDLGVTDDELTELADRYEVGQSLFRTRVSHFSTWNYLFPVTASAALAPGAPPVVRPIDDPSIRGPVLIEKQAVAQNIALPGTPFSLHYQTDRTARFKSGFEITVPLIGKSIPRGLKEVFSYVSIAGRQFDQAFEVKKGQQHVVEWDGKDAFGRTMQGRQIAHVSIAYLFAGSVAPSRVFGIPGQQLPFQDDAGKQETALWQDFEVPVGTFDAAGFELGGFGLDALHAYDPSTQTIYFGSGLDRTAQNVALSVSRFGDNVNLGLPINTFAASDGSVLVSSKQTGVSGRILSVAPDQTMTVVAGPGAAGAAGRLFIGSAEGVAMGSDGSIVFADSSKSAVRSVAPDGSVQTLISPLATDNPIVQATLSAIDGVAFGPRGELYVASGDQLTKFEGGQLTTFAGGGTADADEVQADQVLLVGASGVAVAPDGTVFVSERGTPPPNPFDAPSAGGHRIRKIGVDGVIHTLAGSSQTPGFSGDGLDSASAQLSGPRGLSLGQDGALYIADQLNKRIRRITPDGLIETVVGGGDAVLRDGQLAQKILLSDPNGVSVASDGALLVATSTTMYRAAPGLPQPLADSKDSLIPSTDGLALFRFDSRGKHLETIDAVTGVSLLQFQYDNAGLLNAIKDNNSVTTSIQRDSKGQLAAIQAQFGQRTTFRVDAQDRIITVTNPLDAAKSRQASFAYDDTQLGLMSSSISANGKSTDFEYDALGRVKSVTGPTGYKETFAASLGVQSATFDVTTRENHSTRYANTLVGSAIRRDIRAPDNSHVQWDDKGIAQPLTAADGTRFHNEFLPDEFFGAQALLPARSTITTPGGRTLTTDTNQAYHRTDPRNALSTDVWSETSTTNERKFTTEYSRLTQTRTTISAMGRTTTTTLDAQGRPTDFVAAGSPVIHWNYDRFGRPTSISSTADGTTRAESFTYDSADGFMEQAVNSIGEITTFNRDFVGRLHDLTRSDKSQIFWTFDDDDHVLTETPPGRSPYQFNYQDGTDLLISSTPPGVSTGAKGVPGTVLGETKYDYGDDDQLLRIRRSDGYDLSLGYEQASGRLKTVGLKSGPNISFGYDPNGTLTSINRSDSARVDMTYDGSLWTGTSWSGAITGKVTADYDKNFWLASLTVNEASTVNFSYDDDGLITRASSAAGTLALDRAPDTGFLTGATLGTVTSSQSYNGFGEVAALSAKFQKQIGFSQTFQRDNLGRISHISETVGTASHELDYVYDNLGQLTQVTRDGSVTVYGYDSNGNRISVSVDGVQTVAATFDEQERILTHGSETFQATETGDVLQKSDGTHSLELTYDELGNLVTTNVVTGKKATTIDYVVDGTGRRIARKINGKFDRALLYRDQFRPVAEIDSAGTFSHFVYTNEESAPDAILQDGVPYRVIKDHLGSVRLVINAKTGVVAQKLEYDEFGVVVSDSNPGFQPFGFAGGLYDPITGLVRFGARDYDAEIGRWVAKDPIGFAGGTNAYQYAAGDPINFVDSTGLDPSSQQCQSLKRKIDNIQHEIDKRIGELHEDKLKLPETAPGDDANPSLSVRGHRVMLSLHKANIAALKALYLSKCGGNPPGGQPPLGSRYFDRKFWEEVTGLTGWYLVAYLVVSEGSRLIPLRNAVPVP